MNPPQPHDARPTQVSDAAVDGLLYGLAAGLLMAMYLLAAAWTAGLSPGQVLGGLAPSSSASPLSGALTHLAVSGVYGLLYGLALRTLSRKPPQGTGAWAGGLIYGTVLWALARVVLLPASGSSLLDLPPAHVAIAHALYGLALGFLMGRSARGR